MIYCEFKSGQGLGNQLWIYATTRVLAIKSGLGFTCLGAEFFKGFNLFNLDLAISSEQEPIRFVKSAELHPKYRYLEEREFDKATKLEISGVDDNLYSLKSGTLLEGNLQQIAVIERYRTEIQNWFRVEKPRVNLDNTAIINFRGGEYFHNKQFFLPLKYWRNAIAYVQDLYPGINFAVITDDKNLAQKFFPGFPVLDFSMEEDFRFIAHARVLILSNSSFAWFPAWLNDFLELCVVPKYWWGFNAEIWSGPGVICQNWHYLSKEGSISKYESAGNPDSEIFYSPRIEKNYGKTLFFYLEDLLLRIRLIGVRRRKSRIVVWTKILSKKLFSSYIVNGATNKIRIFRNNRKYHPLEKKIWFFNFALRSRTPCDEHRKVIDICYLFNELDILELRLQTLWNHVDHFVICESSTTFTGKKKESSYLSNQERFKKFSSKIIYIENDLAFLTRSAVRDEIFRTTDSRQKEILSRCLTDSNIPPGDSHWINEYYQKEFPLSWIDRLEPNAIVLISDVDEIWNPEKFIEPRKNEILVFRQKPFVYFMNIASDEHWNNWTGTVLARAETWKSTGINPARTHRRLKRKVISKGGWHFSFQGGEERVLQKLSAYGHQELNRPEIRDSIKTDLINLKDLREINCNLKIDDSLSGSLLRDFKIEHPEWFYETGLTHEGK